MRIPKVSRGKFCHPNTEREKGMEKVDTPIKSIIERLNDEGFITHYSCCGFDYADQIRKDHTNAYVIFEDQDNAIKLVDKLIGYWECLPIKDVDGKKYWFVEVPWNSDECPIAHKVKCQNAWFAMIVALELLKAQ